jgi:hypothetical protein
MVVTRVWNTVDQREASRVVKRAWRMAKQLAAAMAVLRGFSKGLYLADTTAATMETETVALWDILSAELTVLSSAAQLATDWVGSWVDR